MSRVRRIVVSFAIVLGAFWLYRFTAVPLIEPEVVARVADTSDDLPEGNETVRRHEQLLAKLYAEGAWQRDNPIVMEGDHVMFVLKEWHNLDNGQVQLFPCTMIFFPSGDPNVEAAAISRALVLEAPQGALLEFDEPFDIRRAKIGRLVGGHMPGVITLRGNSSGPNGQDEIFAQTHDIQLNDNRIWTPHPVNFRVGPTYGSGREMQIHLLPATDGKSRGPNIGGVESFELLYEVTMHLQPEGGSMFPGDRPAGEPLPAGASAAPQPPIDIMCQGPFHFEMASHVASFADQVNVLRASRGQQSDQMTCEKLSIYFVPRSEMPGAPAPTGNAAKPKSPERSLSSLVPRRLVAEGLPVVVTSPSTGAYAKAQRLEYDMATQELKMQAEDEAMLHQDNNDVRGREITYVPPDPRAKANHAVAEESSSKPAPQVTIQGAAQFRSPKYGQLTAEQIYVWLIEEQPEVAGRPSPAAGPAGQPGPQSPGSRLVPERFCATGNVDVQSPQLSTPKDRTIDKLQVWFRHESPRPEDGTWRATNPLAGPQPSQAVQAGPPGDAGNPAGPGAPRSPQHFQVAGQEVQMEVVMRGRQTEVDKVRIYGNVYFAESQTPQPDERPLVVTGDALQVDGGASPQTLVMVTGNPARVDARGLALAGATVNLSRGRNRLWIDGAGQMTVPMDRDLRGQLLAQPRPMTVTWRKNMDFDGLTAHFVGDILGRSETQTMRTDSMDVQLARRIDFNQPPRGEQPQVAQIDCHGGVDFQNQAVAPAPPAIQHMQTGDLSVNQITGEVHAAGPGYLTMVRLGSSPLLDSDPLARPNAPAARQPAATGVNASWQPAGRQVEDSGTAPRESELNYLNIQFQQEITGNTNERQLTFHGQVHVLSGPIKNWDDQLNDDRLEGLGPRGVAMKCDALKLVEMTPAAPGARGTMEMEASGNVLTEGVNFTARGGRLTYAEAKDLIVLEGDGRTDATLDRQQVPGGQSNHAAARKLLYWRSTERVEGDDVRFFDIGQMQAGPAQPKPPATPGKKKP